MPIMLATYSTNKIIVLKRYVSEKKEININQTNTLTQTNSQTKKWWKWEIAAPANATATAIFALCLTAPQLH